MLATPRISRTRGSLRSESVSALRPGNRRPANADSPSGSCTTTRIGWIAPLAPIARSVARPWPDSDSGGNQLGGETEAGLGERGGEEDESEAAERDRAPGAVREPTRPAFPAGRCVRQRERRRQPAWW